MSEKPDRYEEIVIQAVSELMGLALENLENSDEKIITLNDELAALEHNVTAILPDREGRALLDRYLSLTHGLDALRQEHLYVQGAKDCVRMLKELGALA